jgi:hypothetical protein
MSISIGRNIDKRSMFIYREIVISGLNAQFSILTFPSLTSDDHMIRCNR